MMNNYKVVFIPQAGASCEYVSHYSTLAEAIAALSAVANYTLVLHECSLMPDYSNMGMLFEKSGDDWIEIGDDGIEI